jgi:hypothetical protein
MIFIGPNDLAQALLGYVPARGDEPEYVAAVDKIVNAAKRNGKWVGRLVNNGALAKAAKKTSDSVATQRPCKIGTLPRLKRLERRYIAFFILVQIHGTR